MNRMSLACAALLLGTSFAVAQTTEFYIVQDVKTKRCRIVEQKPTTTTEVTVVGNTVYKTRTEAEAGVKKVEVCSTN